MGVAIQELPSTQTIRMKLLVLISLVTLSFAFEDGKMVKYWEKMKAAESCWGEENVKLSMVAFKKAFAKCGQEDAPELSLPPFRSTYRFVNTLLNGAKDMENRQANTMYSMMESMMKNKYNSYGNNDRQTRMKMFMTMMRAMMGNNMNDNNYNYRSNNPTDSFGDMFNSRSKRAADPSLDLGDRLVEKLQEKQHMMKEKIGNMTCVFKEMGCLNHKNELDLQGMKDEMNKYAMPVWFQKRYEEIIDTCYEMATNLPAKIEENAVVTGENFGTVNIAQVKTFWKCHTKAENKLCMNQDIKKKIEANFGPLEEILEQTQMTEYQLFPLVMQLLHGEEMEYMMMGEN